MGMPSCAACAICSSTGGEIAGFCSTRSTKPVVSAAISTEPMSAVPSEAPRFCAVPCSPPASLVCSGSTEDMITLPSWDSISPAPAPNSASASAKSVSSSSTSIVPSSSEAHREREEARLATRLGERPAASRGPASAAMNSVTDIGNSLLPVSKASRPSTTCR